MYEYQLDVIDFTETGEPIEHINEYTKTCYAAKSADEMNFDAAQADCNSEGSILVEPKGANYLGYIEEAVFPSDQKYWLGIKKMNGM